MLRQDRHRVFQRGRRRFPKLCSDRVPVGCGRDRQIFGISNGASRAARDSGNQRGRRASPPWDNRKSKLYDHRDADGPLSFAQDLSRPPCFCRKLSGVSGSGTRGVEELTRQTRDVVRGPKSRGKPGGSTSPEVTADKTIPASVPPKANIYPHPIAFNVLPHIDSFLDSGYTKEEVKMQDEARKIMHSQALHVSATCVRVPIYRAHSVAVDAEFQRPLSVEQAREILSKAPGLELVDEPHSNRYPTPLAVAGKDNCQVGRVRLDCAFENGLAFWVSGDQLLKGAA